MRIKKEHYHLILLLIVAGFVFTAYNNFGLPEQLRYPDHLTGRVLQHFSEKSITIHDFHRTQFVTFLYAVPLVPYFGYLYLTDQIPTDVQGIYDIPADILTTIVMIGRYWSALFSLLTVLIVYFIGKELKNHKTGMYASVIYTFSAIPIAFSHFVTDLTPGYLFYALAVLLFVKWIKEEDDKYLWLSAVVTGLAVGTKYSFAYVAPMLGLFLLFLKKPEWHKKYLKHLLRIFYFGMISVITFFIVNPSMIFKFNILLGDLQKLTNYREGVFSGITDHYSIFYFPKAILNNFGLISIIIFLGLVYLIYVIYKKKDKNALFLLYGFLFLSFSFGFWKTIQSRIISPLFIFLVLAAALFLGDLPQFIKKGYKRYIHIFTALLLILAIFYGLLGLIQFQQDSRDSAYCWLEQNVPEGSSIATFGVIEFAPYIDGKRYTVIDYRPYLKKIRTGQIDIEEFEAIFKQNAPDFIIDSSQFYGMLIPTRDSFLIGAYNFENNHFPGLSSFYTGLINGTLRYNMVYQYTFRPIPFMPIVEFINPTIIVLKKENINLTASLSS